MKKHPFSYCEARCCGAAEHDLTVTFRKTQDLAAPLGFDRRGADDEDLADARFPREQLGNADGLNGLAEPHVIGEDRAPGSRREGDAVQLVRQELDFQQRLAQRVGLRIAPDIGSRGGDALLQETRLDVLFGVGIDCHRVAVRLESPDAFEQVRKVGDGLAADRTHDSVSFLIESIRQKQPQLQHHTVGEVHGNVALAVRPAAHRVREASPNLLERMEDVLTGSKGVLAEIRARAVRITRLPSPESHAVGLAGGGVGDRVIRPDLVWGNGQQPHLLRTCALLALRKGLSHKRLLTQAFYRHAIGRRIGEAQRELLLEDQRECGTRVLAGHIAGAAAPFEAITGSGTHSECYGGRVHGEAKPVPVEFDLGGDVDVVLAAGGDEAIALGTQEFRAPEESQARECVKERQLGARLRQHGIWDIMQLSRCSRVKFHLAPDGLHDGDAARIDYLHLRLAREERRDPEVTERRFSARHSEDRISGSP